MFQVCKLDVQSSSSRSFTAILTDCNPTRQSNFWIEPYKNKAMCIHKEVVIVFSIFTLDMYMLFTISISHTRVVTSRENSTKTNSTPSQNFKLHCILASSQVPFMRLKPWESKEIEHFLLCLKLQCRITLASLQR